MGNVFLRILKFLAPLILLAACLIPATPANAATIFISCSTSDYTTGVFTEYTLLTRLSTQLGPSDWLTVNIPFMDTGTDITIGYVNSSGATQDLYDFGQAYPWSGGSPDFRSRLLIRNGSGPILPAGTILILKISNIKNPASGGIYTVTLTTSYPGTLRQWSTDYGAVKDFGQAELRLGRYAYATSGVNSSVKIAGGNLAAQTITAEKDHRITSLRLKLYRVGSPGVLNISVEQTSGSAPNGNVLSSGTLDTSTVTTSTSGDWYTVPLSTNALLSTGAHYVIVLRASSGDAANQVFWRTTTSGGYAGGFAETSTNSGTQWSPNLATDCLFEEYGSLPYAISVRTSGSGAVIKSPDQSYYTAGQSITLTAAPDAGWHLSSWQAVRTDTGYSTPPLPAMASLNFVVTENLDITANFEVNTYPLIVNIQGEGTVDVSPLQEGYTYGSTVQLTATPDAESGYWFAGWSSTHNTTNPITVTIDGTKIVTAVFSNGGYLELSYTGSGQILAMKTSDYSLVSGPCPSGTQVLILAAPDSGWHFDHFEYEYWQAGQKYSETTTGSGGNNGSMYLTLNSLTKVKAVFSNTYHLNISTAEGNGTTHPISGDYPDGTYLALTPMPAPGWHFVKWSINYSNGMYFEGSEYGSVEMDQDVDVKVFFAPSETNFNITAANGAVTVDPSPGPYTSTVTPSVTLTATPNSGWKFDHWYYEYPLYFGETLWYYDPFESADNPLTLPIDDSRFGTVNVTAYFVPDVITGFTLTIKAGGHGTVTWSPVQASYADGDVVDLSATPAWGYHFVNWTGAAVSDPNSASTTITMKGNYSVQANFANDPPTISGIPNQTTNEDTGIPEITFTVEDTETAAGSLIITKACSNTGLIPLSSIVVGGSGSDRTLAITPAPNRCGTASITITVRDGPGVKTFKTFQVNVNSVNDAPLGANNEVTTFEDTDYIFTTSDFGFTDPFDNPANTLYTIEITTLPSSGILRDDGVPVSAGQFISAASISSGKFAFSPAADENGSPDTSFTFQVQDNGGTTNGGVDLGPTSNTLTLDVTPVNDPPSFTAGGDQEVSENSEAQTVSGWATGISSGPADESGQTLNFIIINDNPGLFATPPAVDAASGDLTFTPADDTRGSATVTVKLQDDGGTDNNGQDTSAEQTFTITVTHINTKPTADALELSTDEETPLEITLSGRDAETIDLSFIIIDNPVQGTLSEVMDLPGISGAPNTDSATLTYTPPANYYGNISFTYKVRDAGDSSSDALESDPVRVDITVNPISDPTSTEVRSSINPSRHGQAVTFAATVTSAAGTPSGTVSFLDGSSVLAVKTLSSGQATCSTRNLSTGPHAITAVYSGDTNFDASTSPILSQTVKPVYVQPEPTSTTTEGSTDFTGYIDGSGNFNSPAEAQSDDNRVRVEISSGTLAQTADGGPLTYISIIPRSNAPGTDFGIAGVGLVYSLGPEGAEFSQPIKLTLQYTLPLPDGLSEDNLYIAYFNLDTNQWEELSPCKVDKANRTVSVWVSHLSLYQIQGHLVSVSPIPTASITPAPETTEATPAVSPSPAATTPAATGETASLNTSQPTITSAAPSQSQPSQPAASVSWQLIIGIIAAVLVVVMVIAFRRSLFRRG